MNTPTDDGRFLCWAHLKVDENGLPHMVRCTFDFETHDLMVTDADEITSVFTLNEEEDPCMVFDMIGERNREGWQLLDIGFWSVTEPESNEA